MQAALSETGTLLTSLAKFQYKTLEEIRNGRRLALLHVEMGKYEYIYILSRTTKRRYSFSIRVKQVRLSWFRSKRVIPAHAPVAETANTVRIMGS